MNLKLKSITGICFMVITLGLSGCYFDFDDDDFCEKGRGSIITNTYSLPPFSGISNSISANIYIRQGEYYQVSINSNQNIIDEIITRVEGDYLTIDSRKCISSHNTTITITTPELSSITNFGSGSIYSSDVWLADNMNFTLSGSGEVEVTVDCEKLDVMLTGSGHYSLSGYTDQLRSVISGSGNVNAFGLNTNFCKITVSGSGNHFVHVDESLTGTISGSGNVYYRGFPATIDFVVSGSGRVINRN